MSKAPLPNRIEPRRSAENGVTLEGDVALNQLDRLVGSLVDSEGAVDVSLQFGVDEDRVRHLVGQADVTVQMQCQRCLEAVAVHLNAELALGMVYSDEAARALPKRYDPLLISEDEKLDIYQLIEDELLLNLPLIAHHDDCVVKTSYGDEAVEESAKADQNNPFSVLAQLKAGKH